MCLSNVYEEVNGERELLYKNVADIRMVDNEIVFTDIMGIRTKLDAKISRIDLMENYILVER